MIPVGKYDSPQILRHCLQENSEATNVAVNVTFLVDPGDGGAPEEINHALWIFQKDKEGTPGAVLNPRAVQSLAYMGFDVAKDSLEMLNEEGVVRLSGDGIQIDIQDEEWTPKNEDGSDKVDEYGQRVTKTSRKVKWINRRGSGPVEAASAESASKFSARFREQIGGVVEKLGQYKLKPAPKLPEGAMRPQPQRPSEREPGSDEMPF